MGKGVSFKYLNNKTTMNFCCKKICEKFQKGQKISKWNTTNTQCQTKASFFLKKKLSLFFHVVTIVVQMIVRSSAPEICRARWAGVLGRLRVTKAQFAWQESGTELQTDDVALQSHHNVVLATRPERARAFWECERAISSRALRNRLRTWTGLELY